MYTRSSTHRYVRFCALACVLANDVEGLKLFYYNEIRNGHSWTTPEDRACLNDASFQKTVDITDADFLFGEMVSDDESPLLLMAAYYGFYDIFVFLIDVGHTIDFHGVREAISQGVEADYLGEYANEYSRLLGYITAL